MRKHIQLLIFGLITLVGSMEVAFAEPLSRNLALLHGLARSASSMDRMEIFLKENGFSTCNIGYPSRHHTVEVLVSDHVLPAIRECFPDLTGPVNFVTHSLGGILVRQISTRSDALPIGRVVMLGPPNGGSEVVDALADWPLFELINGPAGKQLGTAPNDLPKSLGSVNFELGVIAGSRSINPILSVIIPGEDDGKVSIANAKVDGMSDFKVLPVSHPFLMKDPDVMEAAFRFLIDGRFD